MQIALKYRFIQDVFLLILVKELNNNILISIFKIKSQLEIKMAFYQFALFFSYNDKSVLN